MKIVLYGLLGLMIALTGVGAAAAAPFLVADPYPAKGERPVKFLVTIGGKTTVSTPAKNADGSVYLKYDLGALPDGTYTVSVKAVGRKGIESPPGFCSFRKTGSSVEFLPSPKPKSVLPPPKNAPPPPKNDLPRKKSDPGATRSQRGNDGYGRRSPGPAGDPCAQFLHKTAGLRKKLEVREQGFTDLKNDGNASPEEVAKWEEGVRDLRRVIEQENPQNCRWRD